MIPADGAARHAALDGRRSFIVQAPAGSGKTELLIQRYLTLLAGVDEPEQVVAITFTRKAAAEMRARISAALDAAASEAAPDQVHRAATHALAEAVLTRDAERGWSLRAQPQRMRIDTLDALNAWLARQLPLLAGGVAAASIEERADEHYARAARRTVDRLADRSEVGTALRRMLRLLDNSLPRLEALIAALLPKRDQWLGHLLGRGDEVLRQELERGLEGLVREALDGLEAAWPESALDAAAVSLRHAAERVETEDVHAAAAVVSRTAARPAGTEQRLALWRGIAALLLTDQGRWRRRVTKTQGFATTDTQAKAVVVELLASLAGESSLEARLHEARRLPEPRYGEAQWRDLVSLRTVLLQSVAELRVIFAEHRSVDFVELALAAQQALGRVDEPSELLLALDRRIQHFLIDEFQDTSRIQLRLLELLTAGWQRGDGRSLFLVGDPMQSIYRFRDADMSLFGRVIAHGIGDVHCEFLQLEANFRSAPRLVGWVNETFARIFASDDRTEHAQALFHASHAERETGHEQGVFVHEIRSDDDADELARVMTVLEQERARSAAQSIAVLVQSRPHLLGLHDRLLALGWPVHALEIDAVTESQCGQDLLGLTRALAHLGDRIAWLAVLRAPWCGMTWDDLEKLCGDEPRRTVWALMDDDDRVARLSSDGAARLRFVRGVFEQAFEAAPVIPFAHSVERCWHALRGPACLSASEREVAEHYFVRLAELAYESSGSIEPATLEQAFARPQASPGPRPEGGIEIMTIHRAKGLEFDTVLVFGLARPPRRDDARALYWHERAGAGGPELVLAPIQRDDDALSRFLRAYEERGEDAERARVLYVATTRAKERLHLVYRLAPERETPPARSLLCWLLPATHDTPREGAPALPMGAAATATSLLPRLRRLAEIPEVPASRASVVEAGDPRPEFEWAGQTAAHVGTIVHAELLSIGERGVEEYAGVEPERRRERYARRLALLGVDPSEIDAAAGRVEDALRRVLEDERGRWILGPHPEASSELRLSVRVGNELRHLQLDRTFVDEAGVRWIVDYKTSHHEGTRLDAFLDSEVERYREQLETYASAMAEIDTRPIRVALYFPLLDAFRDWAATPLRGSRTS